MKAPRTAVVGGIAAAVLLGCAGPRAAGAKDPLAVAFGGADAERAHRGAPDLYARAVRARADAAREQDAEAKHDQQLRASALLEAAVAEASRIDAERGRAAAENQAAEAMEGRAALERERIELEAEIARRQAGDEAQREAAAALDRVDRETGHLPHDKREREAVQARAARELRRRAELTLSAAAALGLPTARVVEIEQVITSAERAHGGGAPLKQALAALSAADRGLAEARQVQRELRAGREDPRLRPKAPEAPAEP